MDIALLILGFLLCILGIIGSFLPILPGPFTAWLGLLLLYLTNAIPQDWTFLGITLGVSILVWILDYAVPALGTKKFGGTTYGMVGSSIGLIVGLVFMGPLGIIIGPFAGAFIGEIIKNSDDSSKALKAAFGSFIGFLAGTFLKFTVSIAFLFLFVSKVWDHWGSLHQIMKTFFLTVLAVFILHSSAFCQTPKDSLPGDPSLVSSEEDLKALSYIEKGNFDYEVHDYFQRPKQSTFRFSPDGKYFSYREKDDKSKRHIYVKNTETGTVKRVVDEKDELIRGYAWANNNRLIYVMDKGGNEDYHLFAVDLNGENKKDLTPYKGVRVEIEALLKEQKDYMVITMNKDNPQIFEPYKININTGELEKLYENKDAQNPISAYNFDKEGVLRAYSQQENGTNYSLYYQAAKNQPFEKVLTTTWKDNFSIIGFDYTTEYPHDAFVMSNLNNDTNEIVLYDLAKKEMIKKVFNNSTFDIDGMSRSRKRGYEIDYFYYTGEKSVTIPVSETYKKLHKKFKQKFDNKDFSIANKTDGEDKYLLYVNSDKLYGMYYLYDAKKDSFKEIMNLMPQLKEEDMAEMKPIKFKSRDGLTIYGYLTIPKEVTKGKKVPLIVNPHGGPYGPRDYWEFNPETQLFASRGYATLQINYRGSGG